MARSNQHSLYQTFPFQKNIYSLLNLLVVNTMYFNKERAYTCMAYVFGIMIAVGTIVLTFVLIAFIVHLMHAVLKDFFHFDHQYVMW